MLFACVCGLTAGRDALRLEHIDEQQLRPGTKHTKQPPLPLLSYVSQFNTILIQNFYFSTLLIVNYEVLLPSDFRFINV